MEEASFDRVTREFAGKTPRRTILSAFVAFLLAVVSFLTGGWKRTRAQVTTGGCASEGSACTMLLGCCSGLTCVSSALNPSYGICAPGSGGMVTVGATSLMVPGSDAAVVQAAAMVTQTQSATPVDLKAERQAQLQEKRQKKDQKIDRQRTRRDKHESQQETKRDNQRSRRQARNESADDDTDTTATASAQDVLVGVQCHHDGQPQVVAIRNLRSKKIDVAKVSSLVNPIPEDEPRTPTGLFIEPASTIQLQFGGTDAQARGVIWETDFPIFDDAPNEGVRVELRNGDAFFACCDGTGSCYGAPPPVTTVPTTTTESRRRHRPHAKPRGQRGHGNRRKKRKG